jgi:DNA-binding transcriptional ArsR family regulator
MILGPDGSLMALRPGSKPVDYLRLADALEALAYPARLELLDKLRLPRAVSEIKLAPRRSHEGTKAAVSSRQNVWWHLSKLEEADLVRSEESDDEGRSVQRYSVNAARLYAVTEDLRRIVVMHAARPAGPDATGTLGESDPAEAPKGPRLVLVHGVYEGKSFALAPAKKPERKWTIGRARSTDVCLDYDPFVSQENALVTENDGVYSITDLEDSKNGTSLNWARMPRGSTRALQPADVIGVGRSLLCFAPL